MSVGGSYESNVCTKRKTKGVRVRGLVGGDASAGGASAGAVGSVATNVHISSCVGASDDSGVSGGTTIINSSGSISVSSAVCTEPRTGGRTKGDSSASVTRGLLGSVGRASRGEQGSVVIATDAAADSSCGTTGSSNCSIVIARASGVGTILTGTNMSVSVCKSSLDVRRLASVAKDRARTTVLIGRVGTCSVPTASSGVGTNASTVSQTGDLAGVSGRAGTCLIEGGVGPAISGMCGTACDDDRMRSCERGAGVARVSSRLFRRLGPRLGRVLRRTRVSDDSRGLGRYE